LKIFHLIFLDSIIAWVAFGLWFLNIFLLLICTVVTFGAVDSKAAPNCIITLAAIFFFAFITAAHEFFSVHVLFQKYAEKLDGKKERSVHYLVKTYFKGNYDSCLQDFKDYRCLPVDELENDLVEALLTSEDERRLFVREWIVRRREIHRKYREIADQYWQLVYRANHNTLKYK
jgi:hypothetical protein